MTRTSARISNNGTRTRRVAALHRQGEQWRLVALDAGESREVLRFVCIGLIVAGIVGLKLVTRDAG